MFFTIEPMINTGKYAVKMLNDGSTAVTRDRSLSAQFEHSIGITETRCEIFTASPPGLNTPTWRKERLWFTRRSGDSFSPVELSLSEHRPSFNNIKRKHNPYTRYEQQTSKRP